MHEFIYHKTQCQCLAKSSIHHFHCSHNPYSFLYGRLRFGVDTDDEEENKKCAQPIQVATNF